MHDPNLKTKIFGSMAAAGFFLVCFMAFIMGKSNVDVAAEHWSQVRQTVDLMKTRLHMCRSELLDLKAHKNKAVSEKEEVKKVELSNQLLERENALLMNIYNDLLSNTADCESELKKALEQRGVDDQNLEAVLTRLGYENKQLEETKDTIKQEKKELGELKKKYIIAMRLENRELRAAFHAMREAERELALKAIREKAEEKARRRQEAEEREQEEERAARKRRARRRASEEEDDEKVKEEEELTRHERRRARRHEEDEEAAPPPRKKRCIDLSDDCSQWAQDGECTSNSAYMSRNCRRSCGLCRASSGFKKRLQDD